MPLGYDGSRWGRVFWPGVESPTSFEYTQSHGVAPGYATVRMNPQAGSFANFGDLVITDGTSPVTIRGCRLDRVKETRGPNGVEWELTIADGRWKWREAGYVRMWANQLDPHGKYIPWTIRSPIELAEACLAALGVTRYMIDLPIGLTKADGAVFRDLLPTGVNFPVSGVNPPVDWFYEPAAVALEQLADSFGCRVVPRWDLDEVWIAQRGNGMDLPPGHIASRSPTAQAPQTPDVAMVVGSPTRFQPDLQLQAVGDDWDGLPRPINGLSYAPIRQNTKHVVTVSGTYTAKFQYYVSVNGTSFAAGHNSGEMSIAAICSSIAGKINASMVDGVKGVVTATSGASSITITAVKPGDTFAVSVQLIYAGSAVKPRRPKWVFAITKNGAIGGPDWSRSYPPLFPGVRATDRLTLGQARELARKTVWKDYMLTGGDIKDNGPINVPGYGLLVRRQQLVLTDTQCGQVTPTPADLNIRMNDGLGTPWVQNQYDGYSRDIPAAVYGSVAHSAAKQLWNLGSLKNGLNTGDQPRPFGGGAGLRISSGFAFDVKPDGWNVTDADTGKSIEITGPDPPFFNGAYTIIAVQPGGWWTLNLTVGIPGSTGGKWNFYPPLTQPTPPKRPQVQVSFSVDTIYQRIRFSDHVYKWGKGGAILEPDLRLRTAVMVRDPDTNALVAFETRLVFPGRPADGTIVIAEKHDDVQLNLIPTYADDGSVTAVNRLEDDPLGRAQYYLRGMLNRLVVTGGLVNDYNGIEPIQLDGAIAQVTWRGGDPSSGAMTTASRNYEHNTAVPPYGARRRAEALAAAVRPGGFMGEMVGTRQDPTKPTPFGLPNKQ